MASGLFNFLLTDIEGSSVLWERDPNAMSVALATHDHLINLSVTQNGGKVVKSRGEGDSHFCVFESPAAAISAAASIQRAIAAEKWPTETPIRLRIAIHSGEVEFRDDDYFGIAVNKAARLRSIAHGGQVVVSLATREIVVQFIPNGCSLHDLGEHRLKDLMQPERVFQLIAPDLKMDFPPLRSLRAERNNLPLQLTSFVGRAEEIRSITHKVMRSRLVTLVGPGGCGKTRLALQVAAEIADEFEGGVWFLDLTPVTQPEAVPTVAAQILQAPDSPGIPPIDSICGSMPQVPVLIVLDNCEHLGTAPGQLADALVRRLPNVSIIATSRRPLNLSSETRHIVKPLEVPAGIEDDLTRLKDNESVRLMLERAEARAPDFKLTLENAAAFAELCRALEGIPLAIELAASRLGVLSPEQLVARLRQSLDLLRGGAEDTDERHRTLKVTIDWSYRQLRPEEQQMLVRMSVFPGGCTLETTEKIGAPDSDAIELLDSLLSNSLIYTEQSGSPRYRMLESLRQFCRETADKQFLRESEEMLYAWALECAMRSKPLLLGEQQEKWLSTLEEEYPNLRFALEYAEQTSESENRLGAFVCELDRFWQRKGMIREGRTWLKRALEFDAPLSPNKRALLQRSAGTFAWQQHDLDEAKHLLNESVRSFEELGDKSALAGALTNLAIIAGGEGDLDAAKDLYRRGYEINKELGNPQAIAQSLLNLSSAEFNSGDAEAGRRRMEEALHYARLAKDKFLISGVLSNLAEVLVDRPTESLQLLSEALAISAELLDMLSISRCLDSLAEFALKTGQPELSAKLHECASNVLKQEGIVPHRHEAELQEERMLTLRDMLGEDRLNDIRGSVEFMGLADMARFADEAIATFRAQELKP